MITATDLIRLPYTPDLSAAGIAYACRSLPHMLAGTPSALSDRLPRVVAATAAELAFRRYLTAQRVRYGTEGPAPFKDPDRFDVALAGRRCQMRSFLISRPRQIDSMRGAPELMLKAPALVPLDHFAAEGQSTKDIYLFAFLAGRVAASLEAAQKATASTKVPFFLIHTMPKAWRRPQAWNPLGPLVLKSESRAPLQLELGGEDGGREFLTRSVELVPRMRLELHDNFYSVSYLHALSKPGGRLGIYSPIRHGMYLAEPGDWRNIWVYGLDIWLVGWITRQEFGERAILIREGSRVFQLGRTRTKNLGVSMRLLKPVSDLLDRARHRNISS